jgi:hypothetical protein
MQQVESNVWLQSGSRTTLQTQDSQTNRYGKGIKVAINASVVTSGAGLTVSVMGEDALGNSYVLAAATKITSATTTPATLTVYPGLTNSSGVVVNDVLPAKFHLASAVDDSKAITYSVTYDVMP